MYKQTTGFVVKDHIIEKAADDVFFPKTVQSRNYKKWISTQDFKTCANCVSMDGKIYGIYEAVTPRPPLHLHCRCVISQMRSITAGEATKNGKNGADWWLKHKGKLPDYYITSEELGKLGWNYGQRPSQFISGKMLAEGIYNNDDGHLPQSLGRIWHTADINYSPGRRNKHRIVYSNDGLIFVTYDHYRTFYEII